jgi:hypothetical protein
MANVPSNVDLIQAGASRERAEIFTSCPGQIHAAPGSGYVDVLPLTRKPLDSKSKGTTFEDLPIVPHVRVCMLQGGGFSVTFPVKVGDTGLLIGLGFDVSEWLRTGEVSNPPDLRQHHLANCVFLPAVVFEGATAGTIDDPDFVIDAPGSAFIRLIASASEFAARADKVDAELTKISTTLGTGTSVSGGAVSFGTPYSRAPTACEQVKIK